MENLKILSIIIMLILTSCKNEANKLNNSKANQRYIDFKKDFDSSFVRHFPESILSERSFFTSKMNISKNDVGFYLYEYDVEESSIYKIMSENQKRAIAKYNSQDSILFIVNRYETIQTYKYREAVSIEDSIYLIDNFFLNFYPIPNFIDYENAKKSKGIWIPKGYKIYVLEAKPGVSYKEFELLPNPQMPENWKNGFSRGIAINEKEKTVIYWGVIW